jgi:hypothetical protein
VGGEERKFHVLNLRIFGCDSLFVIHFSDNDGRSTNVPLVRG